MGSIDFEASGLAEPGCDDADVELRLRELGRRGGKLRRVLAALAGALVRRGAFEQLGYARLADYSRERLGLSARKVQELARVDGLLAELPALEGALVEGALSWGRVRVVARVAKACDERAWIAFAHSVGVRTLERRAREVSRGALEGGADVAASCDEEGRIEEALETVALRVSRPVAFQWRRVQRAARQVAGDSAPAAEVLEWVTAEAISGLPPQPFEPAEPTFRPPARGECALVGNGTAWGESDRPSVPSSAPVTGERPASVELPAFLAVFVEHLDRADAFDLDERLRRAVRLEQKFEAEVAPLLRIAMASDFEWKTDPHSLEEVAREWLGMSVRKARALLRLERAGDRCPALRAAWRSGALSWVVAEQIVRLVPPRDDTELDTLEQWVEYAGTVSVRRLREAVGRALFVRSLDPSGALDGPESSEALGEAGVEALEEPARQTGARPTHSEETNQIRLQVPRAVAGLFRAALCSVRLAMERKDGLLPSPGQAFEAMLDHAQHTWGVEDRWLVRRPRRQNEIFERDGWRCSVPGCSSRRELQLHHIVFRSKGGSDEAENQTTLCAFHHLRGVHAARVRITGRAPHGLRFELGTRPGHEPLVRYDSSERIL